MARKAASLAVDQVMLDLEDGIAPPAKVDARARVIASLRSRDWSGKIASVRVNDASTEWFEDDVLDIVGAAGEFIDSIVLPKVEATSHVIALALLLDRVERERRLQRRIAIEPQIESARGLEVAAAIAAAHERVVSLTFGPADYAASINSPMLTIGDHRLAYPGHVWHYPLSRIVTAAKAAGLAAIDGPFGALEDEKGLRDSASMARALGCDGKWAIHPSQIEPITHVFTPGGDEVERARRIAERYAGAAAERGVGAVAYEGELVDAASLRLARTLLPERPTSTD